MQQQRRTDIHVYNRKGASYLLIECKAPNIKLSETTIQQISRYNTTFNTQYLAITNGMKHYVWKKMTKNNKNEQLSEFPFFS